MASRTQLSFASFNLYNLNLPGKPIYRDTDGWSQEEFDRKIDWAANILKTMPSRVWGFQELWHEDALKAVFEKAGLTDDYDLLTPPDHDGQLSNTLNILTGQPNYLFSGLSKGGTDNHKETGTSDHGIVRASFEYRPI